MESQSAINNNGRNSTIEVCKGPDCSAGGGAAAMLEIEELVMEDAITRGSSGSNNYIIVQGGCRDLCSMGPNVHHDGNHYGKVKSAEECVKIAKSIGMKLDFDIGGLDYETATTGSSSSSRVGKMFTSKALRLRWKLLRDVARCKNGSADTKNKIDKWEIDLESVYRTELSAANMMMGNSDPDTATAAEQSERRANRRYLRLSQVLNGKLIETTSFSKSR